MTYILKEKLPRHIKFCEILSTISKVNATFTNFSIQIKNTLYFNLSQQTPAIKKDEIQVDMTENRRIRE